jgi:hypothetical protein
VQHTITTIGVLSIYWPGQDGAAPYNAPPVAADGAVLAPAGDVGLGSLDEQAI